MFKVIPVKLAHQYDDVLLSLLVHVVGKLRQLFKLHHIVGKDLFIFHVINIGVLDVLEHKTGTHM